MYIYKKQNFSNENTTDTSYHQAFKSLGFTCSKSKKETLEKGVKIGFFINFKQISDIILVFPLLTVNRVPLQSSPSKKELFESRDHLRWSLQGRIQREFHTDWPV